MILTAGNSTPAGDRDALCDESLRHELARAFLGHCSRRRMANVAPEPGYGTRWFITWLRPGSANDAEG
jgi:hypothetical protein